MSKQGYPKMRIDRIGAALSRWNDARAKHDRRADAPLLWRVIDRLAGRLYVR